MLLRGSCFSTGSRLAKLGGLWKPPWGVSVPYAMVPRTSRGFPAAGFSPSSCSSPCGEGSGCFSASVTSQPHCFLVMVLIAGTRGQQLPITCYDTTHVTGQKAWSGTALGPHCAAGRIWEGPVGSPLGRAGFLLSPPPSPLVPSPFASGGAALAFVIWFGEILP